MGKTLKKAAGFIPSVALGKKLLGGGSGSGAGDPNMAFFDIGKEVKPFQEMQQQLLDEQQARTGAISPTQTEVLTAMGEAAAGRGPSLAEAQLKAAQDRTLAQQLAAAQAVRGGSAAALQRGLMQQQTAQGRDLAQDAATERLKERERFMQAAQQQQSQLRQDIGTGVDLAVMPKREQQQAELARAQADMTRTQGRKNRQSQLLGGLLGGAASLMASDEEMKKNIKKAGGKDISAFLDALEAKSFDYKEPEKEGRAKGKRYGVMAQALEKSKVGKSLVEDTPEGKMVNVTQGFGAVLASAADLNKRLKKLESK